MLIKPTSRHEGTKATKLHEENRYEILFVGRYCIDRVFAIEGSRGACLPLLPTPYGMSSPLPFFVSLRDLRAFVVRFTSL